MARDRFPRIGTALPGRGNALVKVSMVDENGFAYEYRELEVPMSLAKEAVAQLHLQSDLVSSRRAETSTAQESSSVSRGRGHSKKAPRASA